MYNKVSNKNQDKDIKYLNKDFSGFKNQLLDFASVYYPETHKDFSDGSPGLMFLEMADYVGDVLSFYTDTQLQETFLALAQDRENLYNMAYAMGYKPKVTTAASALLDIFHLVPSKLDGATYTPDFTYALKLQSNSTFKSTEGTSFYTLDTVDFNVSSSLNPTQVDIYQYDSSNNPEYYLLKKKAKSISAERKTKTFTAGTAQQFLTFTLFDKDIINIESMVDSEGNNWHEVPYLAQDTMFEEKANNAANDPDLHAYNGQTPYLLKLIKVPRRYITRFKEDNTLQIQFGAGISDKADEEIIPNPDNIGLGIKEGRSKLDVAYDPSNFLYTRAYGQVPINTTLTVTYTVGGGLGANVASNTITEKGTLNMVANPGVNVGLSDFCQQSLISNNIEAAGGGGAGETTEEIRMNTMAHFSAQQRTVTKNDYLIRTLSMPPKLGSVAKAYITQDDQITPLTTEPNRIPNPLALNLYTLGYDQNKKLTNLNVATKTNLSTYLEQYRMLTDAINIKNAFVINFTLDFEITAFKNFNNEEVLLQCITDIKDYFTIDRWQINQPIIISEVMNLIGAIRGVQTVESVKFENIFGLTQGYGQYKYDFIQATKKDIIYPSLDPSIFELKYPDKNISGKVITY